MSCQFCGYDWCNGSCVNARPTTITVPSPIPPWQRPPIAASYQTLVTDGAIVLTSPLVLLRQVNAKATAAPYVATLPNGDFVGRVMTISIPSDITATTQPWSVTGTINGGSQVYFNSVGFSAVLQWDGAAWVFQGGNAEIKP